MSIIKKEIKKKPNLVLGLSTGSTVIPLYEKLVHEYRKGNIDFSNVSTFNIDEYICNSKKKSFRHFMEKYLFKEINISKENINFLPTKGHNYKKICDTYERKITSIGGIDLLLLGIGRNGHIAFNEPGSSFKSKTRKVKLSETTVLANSRFFTSIEDVPQYALTMGISTLLKSRKIIIMATGKIKATAVRSALKEKPNKQIPASALRKNLKTVFALDKEAASELHRKKTW